VTSNFFYKVPIKPKMPLGAIKQAASDFSQAAKDLVSTGQLSVTGLATAGSSKAASAASLTAPPPAEGTLVDVTVASDHSNLLESAGVGTSLDWTEDDATSLLYTEEGATNNLPHHLQLQDQVPFTPVFTEEEAASSVALRSSGSPTILGGQASRGDNAPPENFLATMEFSVTDPTTPATVKARLPLLQARRQLPFSGTAGTPKRKKPSSSQKKGAKSAGGSLAGDSTTSDEDQVNTSKSSRKNIRDTLAVEVVALKEQLSKVQMELLNKQLETVQIVAAVRSDLTQLHNQLQLYQEAHANLEGVVDRTTSRVSSNEASISDIRVKLSATDRKQEELRQALESLKAMPTLSTTGGSGGPPPAHNAAFFLGGIPQLRSALEFRPQADPMEVVSTVLRDIQMYCAVDRIFLADTQAANRVDTRAVVVYMRTPFHKREAMVKLKKFLAQWRVMEATVRDCFPTDRMERARNLASYGAHLRRTEDEVRRYQVINRNGEPVLQVAGSSGRYTDHVVDEEALRELVAGQDRSREQRGVNRGKTGPRHIAKNKKGKASRTSSGRSSPMATDQDDGPASAAIAAKSSNAVPQGPQRTTKNLELASLRKKTGSSEATQPQPTHRSRQQQQRASPPPQPQRQQQPRHRSVSRSETQSLHEPQPQPQPQPRQPLQPQPQPHQEGQRPVVPQPGGVLRRVAPPQHMANGPYGPQWYPVNHGYLGPPMAPSSDFTGHGGPMYASYSSADHVAGPSGYVGGQYGPPMLRYNPGQQLASGDYRNGDM
jgi:hypothetical protein